jgi:hypothetical protein
MQRVLADGLNMAMEIVGKISNRVISEVEAGGLRGRTGYRALPHVREAVAALEAVGVSSSNGKQWQETMDKTSAVFDPLHLAYNCLTSPEGEVATPDATPQPSPADHAESDPVAVAAARVAERWQEMDQLDTRRVETGADVESEMQHAVQGAVNITKEVLVIICDRVISEVKAGGQRERIGRRALPHANGAMAAMEVITSNSKGRNRYEWMDEVSAVFDPLHLAYNCLVSAESEMATPDATLWPLPAKHAESDPVALAAARVAEKRQELNQLDSRRIETGADVESEMQRAVQDALDITTEIFGNMGDRVVSEVKAGGLRGRIGNRALPHVRDAMAAMEAVVACNRRKCDIHECMDKILAVFGPLALAYNCLAASS